MDLPFHNERCDPPPATTEDASGDPPSITAMEEIQTSPAFPESGIAGAANVSPPPPLSKYRRAYFLFVFCYLQLLCSMVLNGFFSIATSVAAFYQVTVQSVNVMGTIVYLSAALKFPAMYWTERFGVLPSLITGIVFFTLGTAVIRPFLACPNPVHTRPPVAGDNVNEELQTMESGFVFLFLGTVIAQLGQPFFQCLAASLPAHYWPEDSRGLPTALGIAADTTGVGVGMFVCGLPVFASDPRVFIRFTAIANAVGVVLLLSVLWLVPNRGKRSVARTSQQLLVARNSAEVELEDVVTSSGPRTSPDCRSRFPLFEGMYLLFRHCPEFKYAFLGISTLFGVFNVHLTVISEVFPQSASANIYAGLFFLAGLAGNMMQGLILDSELLTHAELIRAVISVLFLLFTCTAFIWTTCTTLHLGFLLYVFAGFMGMGGPGLLATSISFVLRTDSYAHVEKTLLKSGSLESTVTGLMLLGFCLVTAVLNLILNPEMLGATLGGEHVLPWIWWACSIPGYLLLWKACVI